VPDIILDFPINAPLDRVFQAMSTPEGLDSWWTQRSEGKPSPETEYELWFGPEYHWRAKVTRCVPNSEFELEMVQADDDWNGRCAAGAERRCDFGSERFQRACGAPQVVEALD
jgi:uncharacterized protein YndB with AHSA1/START domain